MVQIISRWPSGNAAEGLRRDPGSNSFDKSESSHEGIMVKPCTCSRGTKRVGVDQIRPDPNLNTVL